MDPRVVCILDLAFNSPSECRQQLPIRMTTLWVITDLLPGWTMSFDRSARSRRELCRHGGGF